MYVVLVTLYKFCNTNHGVFFLEKDKNLMKTFEGKTVLITGASSGIGKVFAEKLAASKAKLLLTARREDALKKLSAELMERYGVEAHYFKADLSRADAPWQIYEWTKSKNLQVDVLINNAGFGSYGRFDESAIEEVQAMMQVNIQALTVLTRLYLPEIKVRKGGIIQIASTAAFQPIPYLALYAATKAFVRSFSKALWAENRDVRIFCLCPGNTESEFHDAAGIHQKKVFLRATTEDLVQYGINKFLNSNAPAGIHGTMNTLLAFSHRLISTRFGLWALKKIYEIRTEKKQN